MRAAQRACPYGGAAWLGNAALGRLSTEVLGALNLGPGA